MRRVLVGMTSLVVALAGVGLSPVVASAATGVTINRISVSPVAPGATATIRPNVSKSGPVKITKKYLSVWRVSSGTRLVHKKPSATLKAGTYRVKTTVKFKTKKRSGGYTATVKRTRTQRLVIKTSTATCATAGDASRVNPGDTKTVVAQKLHSPGALDWSQVEDGGVVHEHWRYPLCGSEVQWVWVSYDDGLATDVWVE